MPTNQPSNASDLPTGDARDDLTAAAVLSDEDLDDTPGGGGLGGLAAAQAAPSATRASEGPSRNAPISAPIQHGPTDAETQQQATTGALAPDAAAEPPPESL